LPKTQKSLKINGLFLNSGIEGERYDYWRNGDNTKVLHPSYDTAFSFAGSFIEGGGVFYDSSTSAIPFPAFPWETSYTASDLDGAAPAPTVTRNDAINPNNWEIVPNGGVNFNNAFVYDTAVVRPPQVWVRHIENIIYNLTSTSHGDIRGFNVSDTELTYVSTAMLQDYSNAAQSWYGGPYSGSITINGALPVAQVDAILDAMSNFPALILSLQQNPPAPPTDSSFTHSRAYYMSGSSASLGPNVIEFSDSYNLADSFKTVDTFLILGIMDTPTAENIITKYNKIPFASISAEVVDGDSLRFYGPNFNILKIVSNSGTVFTD
jgi:hypothetical protein